MVNFSNGYLLHIPNCDLETCERIDANAFTECVRNNLRFYRIAANSVTEPFDLWSIFAFNSQVTENYLRRTLELPRNSELAIANAEYWSENISTNLTTYNEVGSLVAHAHQSSHANANDHNLLSSASFETESSDTVSSEGSDSDIESEDDSVNSNISGISEDIQFVEQNIQNAEQNVDDIEEDQETIQNQNLVNLVDIDDISFDEVQAMQAVDAQLLPHSMRNITYITYLRNEMALNNMSRGINFYRGETMLCFICHHRILTSIHRVQEGFKCLNCERDRIYHLPCLRSWMVAVGQIPRCHFNCAR